MNIRSLGQQLLDDAQRGLVLCHSLVDFPAAVQLVALVAERLDGRPALRFAHLPRLALILLGPFDRYNFDGKLQVARPRKQLVQVLIADALALYGHAAAMLALLRRPVNVAQRLRHKRILADQLVFVGDKVESCHSAVGTVCATTPRNKKKQTILAPQCFTPPPTYRLVDTEFGHLVQRHLLENRLPHLELELLADDQLHGPIDFLAVVEQPLFAMLRPRSRLIVEFNLWRVQCKQQMLSKWYKNRSSQPADRLNRWLIGITLVPSVSGMNADPWYTIFFSIKASLLSLESIVAANVSL